MSWRTLNWFLWALLILLLVLGGLGLIGRQLAWIVFAVAGLAELVSMFQAVDPGRAAPPPELTPEMVRTQSRGYDRAIQRLRHGDAVRYEPLELQVQDETFVCRGAAERTLKQDENLARRELQRVREQLEALCRSAPEIDFIRRGKPLRVLLLDPKNTATTLCTWEDGVFRWAVRPTLEADVARSQATRPA